MQLSYAFRTYLSLILHRPGHLLMECYVHTIQLHAFVSQIATPHPQFMMIWELSSTAVIPSYSMAYKEYPS